MYKFPVLAHVLVFGKRPLLLMSKRRVASTECKKLVNPSTMTASKFNVEEKTMHAIAGISLISHTVKTGDKNWIQFGLLILKNRYKKYFQLQLLLKCSVAPV